MESLKKNPSGEFDNPAKPRYSKENMESSPAIDPSREYRPAEIAKNGWILNTVGNKNYKYVLKLVRLGKLKSRNVCTTGTGQMYFLIPGSSIIEYLQSVKESYTYSTKAGISQNSGNTQ